MKPFYRKTRKGVKTHYYWVISHARSGKSSIIHYLGKRPKGKLGELAAVIEQRKLEKIDIPREK